MWDYGKVLALLPAWDWTIAAAWVQAIGSIIALVVAFIIAGGQARRDDKRRKQDHKDYRDGLINIAAEAKRLIESTADIRTQDDGRAFSTSYEDEYWQTIDLILYEYIRSGRLSVDDLRAALWVRREFSQTRKTIDTFLKKMFAGQMPVEFTTYFESQRTRVEAAYASFNAGKSN